MHRLPISEILRPHVKLIISLMLKLLRVDNEENVLVCLRVIIELHKNFRPSFNSEVSFNIQHSGFSSVSNNFIIISNNNNIQQSINFIQGMKYYKFCWCRFSVRDVESFNLHASGCYDV